MWTRLKELNPLLSIVIALLAFVISAEQYQIADRNKDIAFKTLIYTSQIDAATELLTQLDILELKMRSDIAFVSGVLKALQSRIPPPPTSPPPTSPPPSAARAVGGMLIGKLRDNGSHKSRNASSWQPLEGQHLVESQPGAAFSEFSEIKKRIKSGYEELDLQQPFRLKDAIVIVTRLKKRCTLLFPPDFFVFPFDESDHRFDGLANFVDDFQYELSSIEFSSDNELFEKLKVVLSKYSVKCSEYLTNVNEFKEDSRRLSERIEKYINPQRYLND